MIDIRGDRKEKGFMKLVSKILRESILCRKRNQMIDIRGDNKERGFMNLISKILRESIL
jgi:hypothetical protein